MENPFGNYDYFNHLLPVLRKVIELSMEIVTGQKQNDTSEDYVFDVKALGRTGKERLLYEYLCSLSKEELEKIITIMYTGRDTTYQDEYGQYNYERARKMTQHIFKNEKNIIASQIAQKGDLAKYLIDGCQKLSIKLNNL